MNLGDLRRHGWTRLLLAGLLFLFWGQTPALGQEAEQDSSPLRIVVGHTHLLGPLELPLVRIAVGQADRLGVILATPQEVLLNAKLPGHTNLILWFEDGSRRELEVINERDLEPLRTRLAEIDPAISVETSSDGNALILTGLVESNASMLAAVELSAAFAGGLQAVSVDDSRYLLVQVGEDPENDAQTPVEVVPSEHAPGAVSVINLLTLKSRMLPLDQRIGQQLGRLCEGVTVERVQTGRVPDDARDSFVLRGSLVDGRLYQELLTVALSFLGEDLGSLQILGQAAAEAGNVGLTRLEQALRHADVVSGAGGRLVSYMRFGPEQGAGPFLEQRMQSALEQSLPGIRVTRELAGPVADDAHDTFTLEGEVDDPTLFLELVTTALRMLDSSVQSLMLVAAGSDGAEPTPVPGLRFDELEQALLSGQTLVGADGQLVSQLRIGGMLQNELGLLRRELSVRAPDVTVRRLGPASAGVYLLEGSVADAPSYVRLLTVADRVLGGDGKGFEVLADAGGGLIEGSEPSSGGEAVGGSGAGAGALGVSSSGGARAPLEANDLKRNVARGLIVQSKNGRLLSFVKVASIPQVLVSVRLLEVSRAWARSFAVNSGVAWADYSAQLGVPFPDAPISGTGPGPGGAPHDVLDVFRVLSGEARNEFAIVSDKFAFDGVVEALEQEGHVRTLAEPTLVTLTGEPASFFVGGSVAVEEVVATNSSTLQGFEFLPYGISLDILPLVEEDGSVTIDVRPMVSEIDASLQAEGGNGRPPIFEVFRERSLNTTARLRVDEGLVLGGIIIRSTSEDVAKVPILGDIPIIGWLFTERVEREDEREIVMVVFPELVHGQSTRLLQLQLPDPQLRVGGPQQPQP